MAIKLQMLRPLFLVLGLACIVLLGTVFLREEGAPPLSIVTGSVLDSVPDTIAVAPVVLDTPDIEPPFPPPPPPPPPPLPSAPNADDDINDVDYWRSGKFINTHLDSHPLFNSHGMSPSQSLLINR